MPYIPTIWENGKTIIDAIKLNKLEDALKTAFNNAESAANAIRGYLSGTVVRADDVSPVEHFPTVKVHGKNYFYSPVDKASKISGIEYQIQSDSAEVVLNGTSTSECSIPFPNTIMIPAGTYTVSVFGLNAPSSGSDRIYLRNVVTGEVIVNHITSLASRTFTVDEETEISCSFVFKAASTYDNATIAVQIEKGESATDYEPYIAPQTVTVMCCGKNLLENPLKTFTKNNVTVKVHADKSMTISGVPSATLVEKISIVSVAGLAGINVTLPKFEENGIRFYGHLTLADGTYTSNWLRSGTTHTKTIPEGGGSLEIGLVVADTYDGTPVKVYPQLEIGSTPTDYEQYKGSNTSPAADGMVSGMNSMSPSMTIFTDKNGVKVECQYSKDLIGIINKIVAAIVALGGEVAI